MKGVHATPTTDAYNQIAGADLPSDWCRAELRQTVRTITRQWHEDRRYEPACDNWMKGFDLEFTRKLAGSGLLGLNWPTQYGGQARSYLDRFVVPEELLRAGAPVAAHWMGDRQIGPAILKYGSDSLKQHMLPMIARGTYSFCLGMSEPESGSDLDLMGPLFIDAFVVGFLSSDRPLHILINSAGLH